MPQVTDHIYNLYHTQMQKEKKKNPEMMPNAVSTRSITRGLPSKRFNIVFGSAPDKMRGSNKPYCTRSKSI